eukprot:4249506-Pleurochrysis_carterae.AAC.2
MKLSAIDSAHVREYHSSIMEPAATPQMHANHGPRGSPAPSDRDLYTARDKLTVVAFKCEKAVALENYQLQYVEFVQKEMNRLLK